jgi:phosphonate transport system substrate-binding protein
MRSLNRSRLFISICVILAHTIITGCSREETPLEIDAEKTEPRQTVEQQPAEKPLRIAVGGMITPKEGFFYYRYFLDYIGKKLNRRVELVDRGNYTEINHLLKTGDVDAAFLCGGPYVEGHREFGMELLVAPVAHGRAVYYSYIIVAKDSPINSFPQLRGKKFAFTDPMSNTGKLVPTYMLARMKKTPDTFFSEYIFTRTHDNSIKAVAQGIVDGASVDSLIWEYANRTNSVYTSKTKIVEISPPYGIPPVVVRPGLDPGLKKKLKSIFLNAHNDKEGREILGNMMIDKFISIKDSAYDSIREMKTWMAAQERKGRAAR